MDSNRRNLLKAGTSAAVGSLLAGRAAQAQSQPPSSANGAQIKAVPPLAGKVGMRLATCALGADGAPHVVVVLDNGKLVDLKLEATRQKTKLGFDPASMLDL